MKFLQNFALLILGLMVLFFSPKIHCQNTTALTGTLTDSTGQIWSNASWTANLYNPTGANPVYVDGTTAPTSFRGTLSSTAVFSGNVGNNSRIYPTGTGWILTVCSLTSAACSVFSQPFYTNTTTFNAGNFASPLVTVPSIQAANLVYAYNTNEIVNSISGNGYTNTINGIQYLFNGTTYVPINTGGTASSVPLSGITAPTANNTVAMGAYNFSLTGGGNFDVSGLSNPFKLPVIAGCSTTSNGQECYDSTNNNLHNYSNGADNFIALFPTATPPTSGHATGFQLTSNSWSLIDLGVAIYAFGTHNLTIGNSAMPTTNINIDSIAIGDGSLGSSAMNGADIAIGYDAMNLAQNCDHEIAIGRYAGENAVCPTATNMFNTFIGNGAGQSDTTGTNNVAIGENSLNANTVLNNNTALGYDSLQNYDPSSCTGVPSAECGDTAIGSSALSAITTGTANTALGTGAGHYYGGNTTSAYNNTTSTTSVYIGDNAQGLTNGDSNELVFGAGAIGHGSNTATIGNSSVTQLYLGNTQYQPAVAVTASNCNSATNPAVCGSARAGQVVIPASTLSITVNTTAITSASEIFLTPDAGASSGSGGCATTVPALLYSGTRTTGTSFTISLASTLSNQECVDYLVIN